MIRVLVVDDSATVRRILTRELSAARDITVVGTAADPYEAREQIAALNPDVITLDLQTPRMHGLQFLERLMAHYPLPVVVVSSLTAQDSEMALRALELGAVEVIGKPSPNTFAPEVSRSLIAAVRAAATARIGNPAFVPVYRPAPSTHTDNRGVIGLGASTGGTRAIESLLRVLPRETPGLLIVQHLPASFTESFAKRLDGNSQLDVRPARDGDLVRSGSALIAPGDCHMIVEKTSGGLRVRFNDDEPMHHHRPSIDVLFLSMASAAGGNAIGVLLTGMGIDGAGGLLQMRRAGAFTIAESEETCVVFGMPRAAIDCGAAMTVVPLPDIPGLLVGPLARKVVVPC